MVTTGQVLALFAVVAVLTAVPGPSVLFVVSRAVALGRRAALVTVAGNETGLLLQGTAVAVGLGAVVERSIEVYTAIKVVGALYLVYLGVQAVRHRRDLAATLRSGSGSGGARRTFGQGLVVGLTNPKGFLIFAAVLPQFTRPEAGHLPAQMFLLCLVCVAVALMTDSAWALVAGTARLWFVRSPRRIELVGGTSGVVMVGLGAHLALTGRRD